MVTPRVSDIVCEIADDVPDGIIGDSLRLRQILVNLVGNATKFTGEGYVKIRVERADDRGTGCVLFEVEDSGVGIAEDKLASIFDAFTQAEQSTTRRFGGTGLGLAISRELAVRMGGEFEVDSVEGRGATFRFVLPLERASESVAGEAQLGPIDVECRRGPVLVVSPRSATRAALGRLLESWHVDARIVESPAAARRHVRAVTDDFIAVICDALVEPADRIKLVGSLERRGDPSWILLQSTTGHRDGGVDATKLQSVLMPVVGPELRDALVAATSLEPIRTERSSQTRAQTKRDDLSLESLRKKKSGKQSASPKRVLLVEDNQVNQRVAKLLVESWGHTVDVAGNGQVALREIESGDYDVVLMDMQMPVMDGLEATARLREREAETGRPRQLVIAMTANAMRGDQDRCIDVGMDDYLSKPIDADELFEKLEGARVDRAA